LESDSHFSSDEKEKANKSSTLCAMIECLAQKAPALCLEKNSARQHALLCAADPYCSVTIFNSLFDIVLSKKPDTAPTKQENEPDQKSEWVDDQDKLTQLHELITSKDADGNSIIKSILFSPDPKGDQLKKFIKLLQYDEIMKVIEAAI